LLIFFIVLTNFTGARRRSHKRFTVEEKERFVCKKIGWKQSLTAHFTSTFRWKKVYFTTTNTGGDGQVERKWAGGLSCVEDVVNFVRPAKVSVFVGSLPTPSRAEVENSGEQSRWVTTKKKPQTKTKNTRVKK
jgi:hypothetical protein